MELEGSGGILVHWSRMYDLTDELEMQDQKQGQIKDNTQVRGSGK